MGGGPPGAAIGANAEMFAQGLENIPKFKEVPGALRDIFTPESSPELQQEKERSIKAGFLQGIKTPLARIGTEAAISAVPVASAISRGRILGSAARSGALSGVGEAGRELARGEELNPGAIFGATAFGVGVGGLVGGTTSGAPPKALPPEFRTKYSQKPPAKFPTREAFEASKKSKDPNVQLPLEIGDPRANDPELAKKLIKRFEVARAQSNITLKGRQAAEDVQGKLLADEIATVQKDAIRAAKDAARASSDDVRMNTILGRIDDAGAVPGRTAFSESLSAPTAEGGRLSQRTAFEVPKAEKATQGGVKELTDALRPTAPPNVPPVGRKVSAPTAPIEAPTPTIPSLAEELPTTPLAAPLGAAAGSAVPQVSDAWYTQLLKAFGGRGPAGPPNVPAGVPAIAEEAGAVPQLANFFRTRVDAMGAANRGVKAAKAAGEIMPEEGRRAIGAGLQQEAKAAGLPTGAAARQAPFTPPPTATSPFSPPSPQGPGGPPGNPLFRPNAEEIQAATKAGRPIGADADATQVAELKRALGIVDSEKGAVDPSLLLKLLLTGGGGLAGAAFDDENPLRGAAIGAGAGAGLSALPAALKSPKISKALFNAYEAAPRVQRFSHLMDIPDPFTGNPGGLFANAFVGPYGATMTGGLEAALQGDPRGASLMKSAANPIKFMKGMKDAKGEAIRALREGELGRAEGLGLNRGPTSTLTSLTAVPGVAMTMGDAHARRLIQEAGFTAEQARVMTLTSEAKDQALRQIQNLGKGGKYGPLLELLFPFKRTPVNVFEQGAERFPLIPLIKAAVTGIENNAEAKKLFAQQAISIPLAVASFIAGKELPPDQARIIKRYITNASGRFGLGSGAFFSMGQMANKNDRVGSQRLSYLVDNAFPLPTIEPVQDWVAYIAGKTGKGPQRPVPRGAFPEQLRGTLERLGIADPAKVKNPSLTTIGRVRFKPRS